MTVKLIPDYNEILKFKVPLTTGEKQMVDCLVSYLESIPYRDFEIYVQPNLFFKRPDIVVLEPNRSLWIIEVKDYQPSSYMVIDNNGEMTWRLRKDERVHAYPFRQVEEYRRDLLEYASPLTQQSIDSKDEQGKQRFGCLIRSALFLSNYSQADIAKQKIKNQYIKVWGKEILQNQSGLKKFFEPIYKENLCLSSRETCDFRMILNPGENGKNEPEKDFKNIKYRNFVQSRPGKQKARGSAGSGKTTLLAKRVANAAERLETNQAILVTYFNITIGNYLHDKIVAEAGKNLHELGVDLQHFNSLFRWKRDGNRYWIASLKEIDKKYQAIFIDEGQDFEYEWFKVLEASYLAGDGEFVIFADQNQNIYGQKMEQQVDDTSMTYQLPRTPIPGRWNSFDISHRHSNPMITTLANHFVDAYLDKTISISDDGIFINEDETLASQKIIYNYSAHDFDADLAAREVYRYMEAVGNADSNFSINDLAVLSTDRKLLRSLENKMRAMGEIFKDISTTFPPISDIDDSKYQNLDQKTDYDKPYKMKFYRNTGVVKMSTIHSFKGWESPYVVLVIPSRKNLSEDERVKRHDLIYTGITRAKKGIYILNYDPAYHDFFRQLS